MARKDRRQAQDTALEYFPFPTEAAGDGAELSFSFKHLQVDHPKFPLSACDAAFHSALLCQIKLYEGWTVDQFTTDDARAHRHQINFEETTEPSGFQLDEQLEGGSEHHWQFCIDARQRWRVHGFIVYPVFFIVWLDPNHLLH